MRSDDAEDVIRWRSRPDVLAELFSDRAPTREEHERWFRTLGEQRKEYIILAGAAQKAVGTIGLSHIDRQQGTAEYGILIGEPEALGKGLATEASRRILRIAFEELKLNRVYLQLFPENTRACALYRRLGFVEEGLLREHVRKNGALRNVLVMGILTGAWRANQ